MTWFDRFHYALASLRDSRLRGVLMLLAMGIGVGAVVVLTGLGEGARRYVTNEFASLGTNLVIVLPGRTEATGGVPFSLVGETTRDLTLDDARAIGRHPSVVRVAPLNVGSAALAWRERERDVPVMGSTPEMLAIRHWELAQGKFLPAGDLDQATPVVVLGAKVKRELFGGVNPLGEWVRLGDRRFRVIGILASEGRSIGVDVEDVAIIPVSAAAQLFNTASLFRILVEAADKDAIPRVIDHVLATIKDRHHGEEDVTVVTQDAVLATFDRILRALTFAVGGIAAISLGVAGILIMNVMLIAVVQRRAEVGLLKALGASPSLIQNLFLLEAGMLSLLGACCGVIVGYLGNGVLRMLYPTFPVAAPWWSVVAAMSVACVTGILFGVLPARRAAQLSPTIALSRR